jgi:hypothetical protein
LRYCGKSPFYDVRHINGVRYVVERGKIIDRDINYQLLN